MRVQKKFTPIVIIKVVADKTVFFGGFSLSLSAQLAETGSNKYF